MKENGKIKFWISEQLCIIYVNLYAFIFNRQRSLEKTKTDLNTGKK